MCVLLIQARCYRLSILFRSRFVFIPTSLLVDGKRALFTSHLELEVHLEEVLALV